MFIIPDEVSKHENVFDVLKERGFIEQTTHEDEIRELLANQKIKFYIGFDPTADSLHVGHFMQIIIMMYMQKFGHTPIVLVGGGTGMVGDPSGRTDMRKMMTVETVREHCRKFEKLFERFIDFSDNKAIAINNADWLRDMNFMEFFFMHGKPGIFFAVELGALLTVPVMLFLFHDLNQPVEAEEKTRVEGIFPTIALCAVVVCLIIASFIPNTPSTINGIICVVIALLCMAVDFKMKKMQENIRKAILSIDFETLCILTGLFLVIQGITDVGIIDMVANGIAKVGGKNIFLLYTIIVWGSVLFSAFVDNIPYVATMLPIITGISQLLGIEPYLLYFGLLSGATLGGNITPIGASANITAVGMLKQNGYTVKFSDFMKIGLPFTFVAVMAGYLFIWFTWH